MKNVLLQSPMPWQLTKMCPPKNKVKSDDKELHGRATLGFSYKIRKKKEERIRF